MKLLKLFLGIAIITSSSINAQWWGGKKINGNGEETTKTRSLGEYDKVKVRGSLDVDLVYGTEGGIKIEAESNLIEYIVTEVENNALQLYIKKGYNLRTSRGKKILITVPFKDISEVTLSGSGDIVGKDIIKANDFRTAVSGSGDITINVEASRTVAQISGSGGLVIKGNSDNFDAKLSGSGDIEAFDFKAKHVDAAISGSGDIEVTATESIRARVSGSGDIDYMGNPEKEEKTVSGSGDITKR